MATTFYNFCTESGHVNQEHVYKNPAPVSFHGLEIPGAYAFYNVEPLGTYFYIEVLIADK